MSGIKMTFNTLQKLTTTAVSIALGFSVMKANSVQAAIITYDFTTNLISGYRSALALELGIPDNQEFISGSLSYDNSTLTGIGRERVQLEQSFVSLTSSFWTITFTRAGLAPRFVELNNGELVGLTAYFLAPTIFQNPSNFDFFLFDYINEQRLVNIYSLELPSSRRIAGEIPGSVQFSLRTTDTTSIPEPNIALGTCIFGLTGLARLLKKKDVSEQ